MFLSSIYIVCYLIVSKKKLGPRKTNTMNSASNELGNSALNEMNYQSLWHDYFFSILRWVQRNSAFKKQNSLVPWVLLKRHFTVYRCNNLFLYICTIIENTHELQLSTGYFTITAILISSQGCKTKLFWLPSSKNIPYVSYSYHDQPIH